MGERERREEERDEGGWAEEDWELEPTDPSHPDYDLSEAAPYLGGERPSRLLPLARWVVWIVSLIVILSLLLPLFLRLLW